ncbi:succinate dehydrogenase assembly factor 2 [Terasakiella sp. A23]|uniref:succinate dehydrogenase assembly factor 2 n=1 Tax=Terasakiella sp. FCG-A23 TaxID=3080561 RepID=UPI00295338D6|nr:succinate dehydrogenase assembly factor 2 [Terasakiella sp. A23]MDV7340311.1 succinate dehydrogenase assembly factor 2 [Terasakiella sp. A23]
MDGRLKRLHHKCKYMGVHENDVIFARFSERYLDDLTAEELDLFEDLLDENDWDIFTWITAKRDVPEKHQNSVMGKLRECQEYEQV